MPDDSERAAYICISEWGRQTNTVATTWFIVLGLKSIYSQKCINFNAPAFSDYKRPLFDKFRNSAEYSATQMKFKKI